MEIDEAVATIVKYIRETGKSQTEAVSEYWYYNTYAFTDEHKDLLAREGLQARVGTALVSGRFDGNKEEKIIITRVVSQSAEPKESRKYITTFVRTCYAVADGTEKRLIEFTAKDFDFWIIRNREQINGLEAKTRVFKMGKQMLGAFHVVKVIELPPGKVAQLAKAWDKAQKNRS